MIYRSEAWLEKVEIRPVMHSSSEDCGVDTAAGYTVDSVA